MVICFPMQLLSLAVQLIMNGQLLSEKMYDQISFPFRFERNRRCAYQCM